MIDSTALYSARTIYPHSGITVNMTKKTPESADSRGETLSEVQNLSGQDVKADTNDIPEGSLTKFRENVREFTFGVLRPESGIVGEKTYETSVSQTMKNLRKEHVGAAAGIRETLRRYVQEAMESTNPPVPSAKAIQVFEKEFQDTSAIVVSQNTQHIDTTI